MGSMFADVQLHLKKDAVYRFAAPAVRKIHVVLETEFGKFARVKRKVRGETPPLAHQVPVGLGGNKRRSPCSARTVRIVNPEARHPAIRKSAQHLRAETKILETAGGN